MEAGEADAAADEVLQRHATAMFAAVEVLESRLGIRAGFLKALKEDKNDWSFLVRLAVFLQGAIAHAVAHELGRPELQDYFARMNLNAKHGGLVPLAQQLDIVSKRDARFIDALSEVRNRFAHRLANIDSTLPTFGESLSPADFKKLVGGVLSLPGDQDWLLHASPVVRALFAGYMRTAAWTNAMWLCARLSDLAANEEGRRARNVLREAQKAGVVGLLGELRDALEVDAKEKPAE